jgi:hypothetical protein
MYEQKEQEYESVPKKLAHRLGHPEQRPRQFSTEIQLMRKSTSEVTALVQNLEGMLSPPLRPKDVMPEGGPTDPLPPLVDAASAIREERMRLDQCIFTQHRMIDGLEV